MEYEEMTDRDLVWAYYEDPEPLMRLEIAKHIKDDSLREKMIWEAKVMYYKEDEAPW